MNSLECIQAKSKFVNEPHLVLVVDGVPLDALIDRAHPDRQFAGMIPTLLECLSDPKERELVWKRILPAVGTNEIAPVLMCPDDCCLWCTVILAEIESTKSVIYWHRLGLDWTDGRLRAEGEVKTVEWFDQIGPYSFSRSEYEHCLSMLRESFEAGLRDETARLK